MPVAFISTRTSPAFGPSRSSSMISSGFFASNATAARVFICHICLKNLAWARLFLSFEFLVPSELPRQSACSGHHMVCGNPDEHPSVSPEHCTVTPNVKTDNCGREQFRRDRYCASRIASTVLRCDLYDAANLNTPRRLCQSDRKGRGHADLDDRRLGACARVRPGEETLDANRLELGHAPPLRRSFALATIARRQMV